MRRGAVMALTLAALALPSQTHASAHRGTAQWTSHGPWGGPISALAVSAAAPSVVWAGTVYHGFAEPKPGSASMRRDGGRTWTLLPDLAGQPTGSAVADPVDPDIAFLASEGIQGEGVIRTMDGGASWTALGPDGYLTSVALAPP